jgi:sugar fermentation stimulation protein A
MRLPLPLHEGRLLRRYKRFLAEIELVDGRRVTAHCPNTGSLAGCADPGLRVWLSEAHGPGRTLPYRWELVEVASGALVGINTGLANRLVHEALTAGRLPELAGYDEVRGEVRFGGEGSRVDLFLSRANGWERCFAEVKNVTAAVADGVALFPDAVTARGTKHLRELMGVVGAGDRAVLLFCVQRADAREVRPAEAIDPLYGRTLREAIRAGVEVLAYRADVTLTDLELRDRIPVVCP